MDFATRRGLLPLLLLLLPAGIQPVAAQTPTQSPPVQTPAAPAAFNLNVDLDKIRERVYSEAPVITTDKAGIRFYVNTVAPFGVRPW